MQCFNPQMVVSPPTSHLLVSIIMTVSWLQSFRVPAKTLFWRTPIWNSEVLMPCNPWLTNAASTCVACHLLFLILSTLFSSTCSLVVNHFFSSSNSLICALDFSIWNSGAACFSHRDSVSAALDFLFKSSFTIFSCSFSFISFTISPAFTWACLAVSTLECSFQHLQFAQLSYLPFQYLQSKPSTKGFHVVFVHYLLKHSYYPLWILYTVELSECWVEPLEDYGIEQNNGRFFRRLSNIVEISIPDSSISNQQIQEFSILCPPELTHGRYKTGSIIHQWFLQHLIL